MRAAQVASRTGGDLWALGVLQVLAVSGTLGLLGIYWDIAWHIDIGRDTFFTLPHDFLYSSILLALLVSVYGLWRDRRDTPLHLRLGARRLHPGVMLVALGAALMLAFAPMDELWHRLFGTDVALWSPMHLVGLLAMGLTVLGGLVSAWVERALAEDAARKRLHERVVLAFAALLLAWSMLLLGEYEYGVVQFPSVWHPILLTALPVFTLVLVARLRLRPLAATWTSLGFTALRLALAGWLFVTAGLDLAGDSRPMIPFLVLSGLAADLLARRSLPDWLLGVVTGALALAANIVPVALDPDLVWYPDVLALAVAPGLVLAGLAGVLAGAVARALRGEEARREPSVGAVAQGRA